MEINVFKEMPFLFRFLKVDSAMENFIIYNLYIKSYDLMFAFLHQKFLLHPWKSSKASVSASTVEKLFLLYFAL